MSRLRFITRARCWAASCVALLVVGCGEEPTPPRLITITPAALSSRPIELAVGVEYEENDFALDDFQWRAAASAIEGNGASSIIYHAPQPSGRYRIAVTVRYGDAAPLSLDSTIHVTAAVGGAKPGVLGARTRGLAGRPDRAGRSACYQAVGCRCDQRERGWRSGRGRAGGGEQGDG